MNRMNVFLTTPLFSEDERDSNSQTAKRLRENGYEVWLAQETNFMLNFNP